MEELVPPAPRMPWATTAEQLAYRRARNNAVERMRAVATAIEQTEGWLARDDETPGYLPYWQRKTIVTGLPGQRERLAMWRTVATELTREPTELDPQAPELRAALAALIASARRNSPRLRLFTVTVSAGAWRALAPEFTAAEGTRVLEADGTVVTLKRVDSAVADSMILDCSAGRRSVHVPPAFVPKDQASRECYDQLRDQGYSPMAAAHAACDVSATVTASSQQSTEPPAAGELEPEGKSRRLPKAPAREGRRPGARGPARAL